MQSIQPAIFSTSGRNQSTIEDFSFAAKSGDRELLAQLLLSELPDKVKRSDQALQEAAKRGDMVSVRFFIENGVQLKEGALTCAVELGHLDIVKYLVSQLSEKPHLLESAIELAGNKGCCDVLEFLLQTQAQLRAVDILSILDSEDIISSNVHTHFKNLRMVRERTLEIACTSGIKAPGLTSCVANTLLRLGLCQELSQRFVLEYCLKYQRKDVSLIILSNPNEGHQKETHMFVQLGSITVPETLLMGRNSFNADIPKGAEQHFTEFLSANKNSTFVDPLLHCAGNSDSGLEPLFEYGNRHNLTHVIGVRSFHDVPGFVENAASIKNNAAAIADQIKQTRVFPRSNIEKKLNALNCKGTYTKAEVDSMLQCCSEMWDKKAATGALQLEEFRCALDRLLSDMKKYPDLFLACFDVIGADETKYEDLFSYFFSVQQTAIEYLPNLDASAKAGSTLSIEG